MPNKISDIIKNDNVWQQACSGCGFHDSIWKTMVDSPQWQAWYKHASKKMLYDVDECQELGMMSKGHFQDFIKFVTFPKNE